MNFHYKLLILIFTFLINVYSQNYYLILVSFDGFRWDYPSKELTPNLNFIEENGVKALSLEPSFPSNTFPNHISIVTGLYPQNHNIISNNIYDKFTGNYYSISDTSAVRNPKWYKGEMIWETARKQGIITASYFWPGSEINVEYRRPNYFEFYEHSRDYKTRVEGVLEWLKLPYDKRPRFINLYFDIVDTYGHKYGPKSEETNNAVKTVDSILGHLINGLKDIGIADSVNLIVLSDHGMTSTPSTKVINIEEIISNPQIKIFGKGPFVHLYGKKNDLDDAYKKLLNSKKNFSVYYKSEIPEYFNFKNNPMIGDIFVLADLGYSLLTNKDIIKDKEYTKGNHGYDNNNIDMHGIFYAMGPSFKKGYKVGTIKNVNIYPLLCELLNIIPNQNIDGKLEEIEFILLR
ncbi:MAG: ectonucleotide pyrophosphatase/phosphodiesterase [Ignavibacterium sp.]|nr:ectonucleotide pyrophosphatase/phosphodiesterase [Ignavibacterium sp.]